VCLTALNFPSKQRFVLWFEELNNSDVGIVGGKNASLGEMCRELKDVSVPGGFAISAHSYFHFLKSNQIDGPIRDALKGLDVNDIADLQRRGGAARQLILSKPFPNDLEQAIVEAYVKFQGMYGNEASVAVRSSATAEDLPDASFAGQQETFLNVRGKDALLDAVRRCMASLFTNRAISYRITKGFDHFAVGLSVGVQLMVRSDRACAGVMFTIDTESGFANAIVINGSWGLGENVVQGSVTPDEFIVFKPLVDGVHIPILKRTMGAKEMTMVYDEEVAAHGKSVKNTETSANKRQTFCITDEEVLLLSKWGNIIEDHYSKKKNASCPMDIEWAKDGVTNQLFIVQGTTAFGRVLIF
jgi:pyruvate,water dikinase